MSQHPSSGDQPDGVLAAPAGSADPSTAPAPAAAPAGSEPAAEPSGPETPTPATPDASAYDPQVWHRLWELSLELTGAPDVP